MTLGLDVNTGLWVSYAVLCNTALESCLSIVFSYCGQCTARPKALLAVDAILQ